GGLPDPARCAVWAVASNRDCLNRQPWEAVANRGFSFMSQEKIDNFVIRRAEPEDFRELQRINEQPRAILSTLQLPYPSAQSWRKRLEKQVGDHYALVACARDLIVGSLGLAVPERSPRRAHVGSIGMVVHDQWQGRGIGTALLKAAVELADRWL